jgi:hypothetical protein
MIKLIDLDQELKTLEGKSIASFDGKENMTIRKTLVAACELHKPVQPGIGEAIMAFHIGEKIMNNEEVGLEKSEFDFLKKLIENSQIFVAVVIGRVLTYLQKYEEQI